MDYSFSRLSTTLKNTERNRKLAIHFYGQVMKLDSSVSYMMSLVVKTKTLQSSGTKMSFCLVITWENEKCPVLRQE